MTSNGQIGNAATGHSPYSVIAANIKLANGNRGPGAAAQQDGSMMGTGSGTTAAGGASTNLQEFYSPRPVNNNGVGELKTSKSGDKNESST